MAATTETGSYEALIVDFGGVLTTPLQEAFAEFAAVTEIEFSELVRIMLKAYAGEEDSLVTDFGVAKALNAAMSSSPMTSTATSGSVNGLFAQFGYGPK